jgi:lantibiotic modifying enzyme
MLQRRAHTGTDGSVTWIGIRYHSRLGRYRVDPLGTDLYGGAPGIGLFLAALARVTGAGELSTLAHGALSSLRGTLRGDPGSLPVAELGAADGVGSSVLSMLAMYLLTEDDSFLADACADDQLDVLGGSAGAIRALLALHRAGGGDDVLARAERCGRHLLRMRQVSASGYRAWPTLDGACIGGYSHGAAGISSALAALADRTGDADFAAAAEEGFRHQESLYDAGLGAWRSYVESVASEPEAPAEGVASWCHGAAGIALGYLSGGPPVDGGHLVGPAGEQRAVGLRRALTVLCDDVADRSDNLCCGTAGRAAVLLKASRTFGEQRWRTRAEELLSTMLERTTPHGLRVLQGARRGADAFGMFQGVAGIGYTLLQVCADDQLPDLDLLA